ncbi:MAG: hypothetical protein L3J93_01405 [Thermoplasmata archaeon]|nr:hypothetical protein [Thermoplasmata archaeon]
MFRESVRARSWRSLGPTKVTGSVEVEDAELTGPASIGGSFTAAHLRATGTFDADGPVHLTGSSSFTGSVRLGATLDATDLVIEGAVASSGAVRLSGFLRLEGELKAPEVRAGRIVLAGGLEVSGSMTAELAHLELHHDSTVSLLRASALRVTRHIAFPFNLVPFRVPFIGPAVPGLTALRIEASEAELEGVTAEFLKADRIVLGPDCHIARVEGTILRQDPKAHVGPESRSPPPHGLSR